MNDFLRNLQSPESDDVIDLGEYVYTIRKNLWAILVFAAVFSVAAIMVIFSLKPVYQAQATLLIEASDPNIVSIEEVYQLGVRKNEYYFTQFEILKSRELAARVVERHEQLLTRLIENQQSHLFGGALAPSSSGPLTEEARFQQLLRFFRGNLSIDPVRNTQLVGISFESGDPQAAAVLANELAQVYIESNLEARLAMTQQAAAWLAGRIDTLKFKLKESEERLQLYRERENLVEMEGQKTLASRDLEEISSKLSEARRQRVQAENIASQVDRMSARNKNKNEDIDALSAIPAVLQHNLVQRLKEQEAIAEQKLSELSKRYGYKHPKIISAKSELESAKQNTASQIFKVVEGIHKEHEVARATEESLVKEVSRLKDLVQTSNRKQYGLDELTREVAVNRQLYETFFSRIKETAESSGLQTANARVVDPAVASTEPVRPRRTLLSAAAITFFLALGVALVFLREAMDNTIKSRDDIVIKLHTQLLGVLPLLKAKSDGGISALAYLESGSELFSESIRTIRTGVVLSGLDNPHKILVITSSIPGEGKSTVASNLAQAFGQTEKTLLIDADMRRPTIAKSFGLKLSSPGLSNLVAETAELKECIYRMEKLGIDVMPAGMVPPNPLELLSSRRFAAVLASLEKHYDRVIIDSAPCEVVSDALILSTFANAVVYVVKADSTNIKGVKSGISRLREINAPLTGVVLNQVNVDKGAAYGYGNYYGGYYDYYGYSSSSTNKNEKNTAQKAS